MREFLINCCTIIPVYSQWPSDVIWRHRCGSTLAQIRCNGLLLDSSKPLPEPMLICHQSVLWHSSERNFTINAHECKLLQDFGDYILKLLPHLPGTNELYDYCLSALCLQILWRPNNNNRNVDFVSDKYISRILCRCFYLFIKYIDLVFDVEMQSEKYLWQFVAN